MSLAVSTPSRPTTAPSDRSVQEIITTARAQQQTTSVSAPFYCGLGLSTTTALLLWLSFIPANVSPLAWIAPVPLLQLVRIVRPTRRMYWACYLGGLAFYLPALQWMRLGDPAMYVAWWLLAFYLAFSFPLTVALSRLAVHRCGVPLSIAAPAAWVGLDYAKAHVMSGFAWYFLGHTQYRWLELIQISDLVGVYGVTFVMTLSASALAGIVPVSWFRSLGLVSRSLGSDRDTEVLPPRIVPVFISLAICVAVLAYGYVRRQHAPFEAGPRVALIQGNYVASWRIPEEDYNQTFLTHLKLSAYAVREQPDIIIWPEGMVRWPLMSAPPGLSADELQQREPRVPPEMWRDTGVRDRLTEESAKTGAAMIYGIECLDLKDEGLRSSNSAVFVRPDVGLVGRYDKIHLVPFGEYFPMRHVFPWPNSLATFFPDMAPGTQAAVFEHRNWRMAPVICFEDTVPHLVRRIVNAGDATSNRPVDMIVNITNDGWFHGSSELDQHLITAAFRAVECRMPVVRAVNTGISAVIDGDGAILDPEVFIDGDNQGRTTARDPKTGRWHKQLNAAVVQTVPLDPRGSLYVRYGDWFAMACAGLMLFWTGSAWFKRSCGTVS